MSPWHLLWIVPVSQVVGFVVAALMAASAQHDLTVNLHRELSRVKAERDSLLGLRPGRAEVTD